MAEYQYANLTARGWFAGVGGLLSLLCIGCDEAGTQEPYAETWLAPATATVDEPAREATGAPSVVFQEEEYVLNRYSPPVVARPFRAEERVAVRELIGRELAKYPKGVLSGIAERVVVCGSLTADGVRLGGTYWGADIYLAAEDMKTVVQRYMIVRSLHAELSSLLFHAHQDVFPAEEWRAVNPASFRYGVGGWAVLRSGAPVTRSRKQQRSGFISSYARASLEEDFNEVSKELFTGCSGEWRMKPGFARLTEKFELAVEFYVLLDSRFRDNLSVQSGRRLRKTFIDPIGSIDGK